MGIVFLVIEIKCYVFSEVRRMSLRCRERRRRYRRGWIWGKGFLGGLEIGRCGKEVVIFRVFILVYFLRVVYSFEI